MRRKPALAVGAGLTALAALAAHTWAPQEARAPEKALHSGALSELRGVARLAWVHDWPVQQMVDRVAARGGDISPLRRSVAEAKDAWREARALLLELMEGYQDAAPPADALVQVAEQRLESYAALERWLNATAPVYQYHAKRAQADATLGRAAARLARLATNGAPSSAR